MKNAAVNNVNDSIIDIVGIVINRGKKWLTVSLLSTDYTVKRLNLVLVNKFSYFLKEGDSFDLSVKKVKTVSTQNIEKAFYIPVYNKEKPATIITGFGLNEMAYKPLVGNVYVKNGQALMIKKPAKLRNDGWKYDYCCDEWWEVSATIITNTKRGQLAIKDYIKTKNN